MKRRLILLAILLVGGWLRFQSLGAKCLWLDEAISWRMTRYPLLEVIQRTRHPFSANPPLYYILLSLWAGVVGDSEFALRSLAAVMGLLTVAGVYCSVRELTALGKERPADEGLPWAALLAAALTAVSVLQIYNSRQVRMYSTAAAFLAWGGWALLSGLRGRRGAAAFWLLYALLALAACYTQMLALLTVAAQLLFAAVFLSAQSWTRHTARRPLVEVLRPWMWPCAAVLLIAVGYTPWLGALFDKAGGAAHDSWMAPLGLTGFVQEMFGVLAGPFSVEWSVQAAVGVAALLLLAGVFLSFARRRRGWAGFYLLTTVLAPVGLMLVYSIYSGRSLFYSRYLSFIQLDLLATVAVFVAGLAAHLRPIGAAGAAWLWCFVWLPCSWDLIGPTAEPGMRGAFEHIAATRRPGDMVATQNSFTLLPARYYGRHGARPVLYSEIPSRQLHAAAPFMDDGDLLTPHQLIHDAPMGLWWVSSSSYGDHAGVDIRMPGEWLNANSKAFGRDLAWEQPVVVERLQKD